MKRNGRFTHRRTCGKDNQLTAPPTARNTVHTGQAGRYSHAFAPLVGLLAAFQVGQCVTHHIADTSGRSDPGGIACDPFNTRHRPIQRIRVGLGFGFKFLPKEEQPAPHIKLYQSPGVVQYLGTRSDGRRKIGKIIRGNTRLSRFRRNCNQVCIYSPVIEFANNIVNPRILGIIECR